MDGQPLDFSAMQVKEIAIVDNCYNCDCGDGGCDGNGCDCVSCDSCNCDS